MALLDELPTQMPNRKHRRRRHSPASARQTPLATIQRISPALTKVIVTLETHHHLFRRRMVAVAIPSLSVRIYAVAENSGKRREMKAGTTLQTRLGLGARNVGWSNCLYVLQIVIFFLYIYVPLCLRSSVFVITTCSCIGPTYTSI